MCNSVAVKTAVTYTLAILILGTLAGLVIYGGVRRDCAGKALAVGAGVALGFCIALAAAALVVLHCVSGDICGIYNSRKIENHHRTGSIHHV